MGVMTFTTLLYGHELLAEGDEAGLALVRDAGRLALVVFALPVLALLAPPLARGAWDDLRRGIVRMDGLIVLAIGAAFGLSLAHTWRGTGDVYFETATMVLVLVTFGRRLEARAREAGRDAADAIARELPDVAHRVVDGAVEDVPLESLAVGDVCELQPGEVAPADGLLLDGRGTLVAAHVTGESAPRPVAPGDAIPAGAVNGATQLRFAVSGAWDAGLLGRIRDLLAQPPSDTPRQRRVDRLARVLAALSVIVALVAGTWHGLDAGVGRGLHVALSVLLVACPCALGLATPLADRAMRVALARRGLLVRDGEALESVLTADRLVFDKTGTLTDPHGRWTTLAGEGDALGDVATLVARSGHALGRAVPPHLRRAGARIDDVESFAGRGVRGVVDGRTVMAGHPDWVEGTRDDAVRAALDEIAASGATAVVGAVDGALVVVARIDQRLRAAAPEAVERLRERGLAPSLLSGDRTDVVEALAADLSLEARGDCSPEDKLEAVDAMQADGHRVVMVGDGVNDAPVLRAAHVGIAMGSGTAAARLGADVEILGDDLALLDDLLDAARDLARVARGNLAWTVAYNTVALAAAATGRLSPPLAAVAMIVSSMVVALRSGRLLEWTPKAPRRTDDAPAPTAELEPVTP